MKRTTPHKLAESLPAATPSAVSRKRGTSDSTRKSMELEPLIITRQGTYRQYANDRGMAVMVSDGIAYLVCIVALACAGAWLG